MNSLKLDIQPLLTTKKILEKALKKGTAKKFSELDLCYKEEIPLSVISRLQEEFTASNLPFEVELVKKYLNWLLFVLILLIRYMF